MRGAMILAAAVLLAGCMTYGETATVQGENPAEVEARILGATHGRVALAPVSCVSLQQLRGNRALSNQIVLFQGPGARLYINRTQGCEALRYNRALVVNSPSGQLCRGEAVQVIDPTTNTQYGSCVLGDFLPFDRAGG